MNQNKRIAMFSLHTCPLASWEGKETGGMNVYVLELAKELAKKGLKIDVFTRSQDSSQPKVVLMNTNFRVIHLLTGPQQPIPKKENIKHIDEFVKSFISFVIEEKVFYDIFHCHYYLSGLAALSIKGKIADYKNIPIVTSFHTLGLMKNLVAKDELEKEEKTRIEAEKNLVKISNKIIAPSENEKKYLQYLYDCPKEKIEVITPGVDTSVFKPIDKKRAKAFIKADPSHKIILFVGRIEPLKGIDVLLYAIKILYKKDPHFKFCLWIVGANDPQNHLYRSKELHKLGELRQTLGLTTIVKFVGQQPQQKLPYYYSASELVVIPSHYESFGMVALESMACGIPVITTNVSGISELLDKNFQPLITSTNNPLLLARQIEHLLKNKNVHKEFSQKVLNKVKGFSWGGTANKTITLYKHFIKTSM